jgi:hypothetical protein
MRASDRDEITASFAALHEAVSRVVAHSYDVLTTPERLTLLEKLEGETRRLRVPGHELLNQLAEQATPKELGGKLAHALADRLHIHPRRSRPPGGRGRRSGAAARAHR